MVYVGTIKLLICDVTRVSSTVTDVTNIALSTVGLHVSITGWHHAQVG